MNKTNYPFLQGSQELQVALHKRDWDATTLGDPGSWPQSLRITLAILLKSPGPMLLIWDRNYNCFFNDSFAKLFNISQDNFGTSIETFMPAEWARIEPSFNRILSGDELNEGTFDILLNETNIHAYPGTNYTVITGNDGIASGTLIIFQQEEKIAIDHSNASDESSKSRQIKTELAEGEQRFQNLVRDANFGIIVIFGEEMTVTIVNEAYGRLTSRKPADLLNKKLFEVIPEAEEYFRPIIDHVRTTGESTYLNETPYFILIDGIKKEGYLDLVYQPYKEADGTIKGVMIICQDVTEKVNIRKQIEESELRFRTMLEQSPVAMLVLRGEQFVLETANDAMLRIIRKEKNVIGLPLLEIMPEIKGQDALEIMENVFRNGNPYHINELAVELIKDGERKKEHYTVSYIPLKEAGKTVGILEVVLDITSQINARKEIEESEAKFRSLIEEATVATGLLKGRELLVDIANEGAVEAWGRGRDVVGKKLTEAIPELIGRPFIQFMDNIFTTGKGFETKATFVKDFRKNGSDDRYFDFTYKPLKDNSGEVHSILVTGVDVTENVQASQRLAETNQRLELAMDIGELGSFRINLLEKTTSYTEKITEWFGVMDEGDFMESIYARIHPDDLNRIRRKITGSAVFGHTGRHDLVFRIISSTGNVHYLHSIGQVEFKDNAPSCITGIIQDVTESMETQEKLRSSEARLRNVIAAAPAGIALFVGRDLVIENPNQTFIDILGKPMSLEGLPLREAMPELLSEGQPFLKILDDVYTTGIPFYSPASLVKIVQNGMMNLNYYNISYTPLRNDEGDIYAILDIAVDVTGQVEAQQNLVKAEANLRGAIELAALGTWTYNVSTESIVFSERIKEWFGFPAEEASAMDLNKAISSLDFKRLKIAVNRVLSNESISSFDHEFAMVNMQTGQKHILHAQARALYNSSGISYEVTGTVQDVTAQRMLQQELEKEVQKRTEELAASNEELQVTNEELAQSNEQLVHSNEELAQYAYVASHDLQEPLRKILVFTDMLLEKKNITPDNLNLIEKVSKSADRMRKLISDLLDFSRLLQSDLVFQPVNLTEVARNVVTDFELSIEEKNAEISIGNLPVINAVPLQINQLFYNLINNALKFSATNRPPVITITASRINHESVQQLIRQPLALPYAEIVIGDNGIGFEPKYSEQIFEVFKRLHSRDTYAGSGIGLALCKRIVTNMNGFIYAKSALGKGTSFHIILPMITEEE